MPNRVSETPPPDDTGADTFRRFRYQAHVIFRFCLDCALVGNVTSVLPEYFEDVALELSSNSWRFAQIKTRNPDQGPWTLADLLKKKGGALRSL